MSWEQVSNTIRFIGFFTEDGIGATGIAPTFSAYNPAKTKIVNNQAATEIGDGFYHYDVDGANTSAVGEYIGLFKASGTTLDQRQIPALWIVGRAGVEYLNASISAVPNLSRDALIAASGSLNVNSVNRVLEEVDADVNNWRGSQPSALSNGYLQAVIPISGISRSSFSKVSELTEVPTAPYNPVDLLTMMYERGFNRNVTYSGVDYIYAQNGIDIIASGQLIDSGDSFDRLAYQTAT